MSAQFSRRSMRLVQKRVSPPSDLSVAEALALAKSKNIEAIRCTAHSIGLTDDIILILIPEIGSEELSISNKLDLMHCFIPKRGFSEGAFIKMTCLLSDFKFDLSLKMEILKWMISVFAFVNLSKFRSFYEVFLQLLENETLRPYVCHLLHLMTEKQQVTARRINFIIKLLEKFEPEACLTSLLYLYSKLQPEIFTLKLEEEFEHSFESLGIYPELIKKIHGTTLNSQTYVFVGEKKYPVEDTSFHFAMDEFNVTESLMDTHAVKASFNDKQLLAQSSFEEIYERLEILKKSHNMQHILKSKFRRLHLTSGIAQSVQISFSDYIMSSLCSDFDSDLLSDILEVIYEMQESSTAISDFIRLFIEFWNGYDNFYSVLEIMSYHEICCFGKIHYSINYIKELLLGASVICKCHCLYYFSKMYQNWALLKSQTQQLVFCNDDCSMFSENDSSNGEYHMYDNVVHNLGCYIDLVCEALISENHFQPCLLNQVLLHYERISIVHMKTNSLVIHLPTTAIYCSALFSLSSYTLDCFSRLMLRHNAEVHVLVANNHIEAILAAKFFKCCFVDVCSILSEGSYPTQKNVKSFLFKSPILKRLKQLCPDYISLFILHMHPALLLKTVSYLEFNQVDRSSPSHKDVDDSAGYFQYLSENGFEVLVKLIYLFSQES